LLPLKLADWPFAAASIVKIVWVANLEEQGEQERGQERGLRRAVWHFLARDFAVGPHASAAAGFDRHEEDVLVFESGAILQQLHCKTMDKLSKFQAAADASWIAWVNASIDHACFLETPDGKVNDMLDSKSPTSELIRSTRFCCHRNF
jgi:hypothetical protein